MLEYDLKGGNFIRKEDLYDLTDFLRNILEEDEEETASNDFEGIAR